jgi:phospholipase D1/2
MSYQFTTRQNCLAKFLLDGKDYFTVLFEELKTAKSQILIAGWFFSSQLYFPRGFSIEEYEKNQQNLSAILLEKAEQGVSIRILLWNNPLSPMGLFFNTTYFEGAEEERKRLDHKNIEIVLQTFNPMKEAIEFIQEGVGSVTYSNHQKFVVIDQRIGFCGGIDLAFNRYEEDNYPILDQQMDKLLFPGKDYVNPTLFEDYSDPVLKDSKIDRFKIPRMPWRDMQVRLEGDIVLDLAINFSQRWSTATSKSLIIVQKKSESIGNNGNICNVRLLRSASDWNSSVKTEHSFLDSYLELIENSEHYIYIENQYYISQNENNKKGVKNKLGFAIINRILKAHKEKKAFKVIFVLPSQIASTLSDGILSQPQREIKHYLYESISKGNSSMIEILKKEMNSETEWKNYLTFSSLRKYEKFLKSDEILTELVLSNQF